MLLTNPGGPGESGVDFVLNMNDTNQATWGSNYDLVSFDPRGLYRSKPSANCSSSSSRPSVSRRVTKLPGPEYPESYWNSTFDNARALGDRCEATIGGKEQAGPHMTTAVNARDMVSIIDAFARTKAGQHIKDAMLLNYWGFSYGTFLGQTFASMFPDRVGRLVLDGNVDPEDYLHDYGARDIVDTDAIISTFFEDCHLAGPSKCSFHTGNTTQDIISRFYRSFTQLDAQRAERENWTNATTIGKALIAFKRGLRGAMYIPIEGFPMIAQGLIALEQALQANALALWTESIPTNPSPKEYLVGVGCSDGDGIFYNRTYEQLLPYINATKNASITGDEWASFKLYCTQWSIKGVDIYKGK